ncbi:MAG: STAS domain-containing protein [Actinomycetota bacterium]|nr:STAS domain-containing protein [Actinomycetota bacterium]
MGLSVSPDDGAYGTPAVPQGKACSGGAFAIGVEEDGSTLRLRLSGEFEWTCIGRVEAALERISQARTKRVILDLRTLEFLDAAGLKTILRVNDRARAELFDLVVVRPRGLANRVFTLTRAGRQLKLVDRVATRDEGS